MPFQLKNAVAPLFLAGHVGGRGDDKRKNPLANAIRLAKERPPDVLAVAGTSVLAFHHPDTTGGHSFQDIRMDCSKGWIPVALEEAGRGLKAFSPMASILSKTAGARGKMISLLNGLIAWPAQTGEDRILLSVAHLAAAVELVRTSTPRFTSKREGRLFKLRSARVSNRPKVS